MQAVRGRATSVPGLAADSDAGACTHARRAGPERWRASGDGHVPGRAVPAGASGRRCTKTHLCKQYAAARRVCPAWRLTRTPAHVLTRVGRGPSAGGHRATGMSPVGLSRRAPPDAGALKRIYAGVTERRADPAWRAHTDAGVCMVGVHNRAMGRPGVAGGTRTPMCVHASADTEHVYVHCWLGATSAAPAGRPGSWRASSAGHVLLARRLARGERGGARRAERGVRGATRLKPPCPSSRAALSFRLERPIGTRTRHPSPPGV
jgi:hypothetical protein